jgi:hypothetical protein
LAIDGFVIDGGQRIAPHVKPDVVFEARKARVEAPDALLKGSFISEAKQRKLSSWLPQMKSPERLARGGPRRRRIRPGKRTRMGTGAIIREEQDDDPFESSSSLVRQPRWYDERAPGWSSVHGKNRGWLFRTVAGHEFGAFIVPEFQRAAEGTSVSIRNLRGSSMFSLDRGEVFGVDERNAEHESGMWEFVRRDGLESWYSAGWDLSYGGGFGVSNAGVLWVPRESAKVVKGKSVNAEAEEHWRDEAHRSDIAVPEGWSSTRWFSRDIETSSSGTDDIAYIELAQWEVWKAF